MQAGPSMDVHPEFGPAGQGSVDEAGPRRVRTRMFGKACFGRTPRVSLPEMDYIFVIVNSPLPVQPVPPVRVHVPEIVLPFTVPERVSVLPDGEPDSTTKLNLPVTFPLKVPLRVNDPLAVPPETKQGEFEVKLKLLTLSVPSPFTRSDTPKLKRVDWLVSLSVAFHPPLILAGLPPAPQPARTRHTTSTTAAVNCFINDPSM